MANVTLRAALTAMALGCLLTPVRGSAQAGAARSPVVPPGVTPGANFSPGIKVGNTLYVSGQLPAANAGDDIQSQTTSAMNAVKAIVEAGGSSMGNVTKCTVFLISQADFAGMNQAYVPFFPTNPPARSTVVVAALVRAGAKIEVECIATIPR
jgi:reactive intermediate/imine deaminase